MVPALAATAVHVWEIDLSGDVAAHHELVLSASERSRATGFFYKEDAGRFVIAHGMTRHILAGYADATPDALAFGAGQSGKPYLASHPGIEFNLSHSGDIALLAIANGRRVGVDVEQWDDAPDHAALAERFFSAHECRALAYASSVQEGFFTAWTRKEAYIKATGHGITRGLDHFDVSLDPSVARLLDDRLEPGATERWVMAPLPVRAGYSAAVAAERPVDDIVQLAAQDHYHEEN